MRSHKEALENHAVICQRCSQLVTHAWWSHSVGSQLHQLVLATDITAGKGNTATRVLDKWARHDICAHLYWLSCIHEFTVAVINKAHTIRLNTMHLSTNSLNIINAQWITHGIATWALDKHHLGIRCQLTLNSSHIYLAIHHIKLIVFYSKFL